MNPCPIDCSSRAGPRCCDLGEYCTRQARQLRWPRERVLAAGEVLCQAGSPQRSIHLVRSGALRSAIDTPEGESQIVAFHFPWEVIGPLAPDARFPSPCQVTALVKSTVCVVTPLLDEANSVGDAPLFRELSGPWHRQHRYQQSQVEMLGRNCAMQKLAMFLIEMHQRAGAAPDPDCIPLPMSRRDIANYLGMALETVSRRLTELREHGVLRPDFRSVRVLRMDLLRHLADNAVEHLCMDAN